MSLLSDKIKTSLLRYWRTRSYIASMEVHSPYGDIEDIVAFKDNHVVVVEVKTSIADLKKDSKKRKHKKIARQNHRYMANHYYFCVPSELEEETLIVMKDRYPDFGLMVFDESEAIVETVFFGRKKVPYKQVGGKAIRVVRVAKRLTKNRDGAFIKAVVNSLANKLTRMMELKFYIGED